MRTFESRTVLKVSIALCALFLIKTVAYARPDDRIPQPFDIGPQPLGPALTAFARQSREEILFAPDVVATKRTAGVKGTMTPLVALKALLKDSGLPFSSTPNGAILVGSPNSNDIQTTASTSTATDDQPNKEGGKSASSFRMAQVDKDKSSSAASIGNPPPGSLDNSNTPSTALSEVIVTAQKRSEKLMDVPSSVSALTGDQLESLNVNSLSDLAGYVSGVSISNSGSPGQNGIVIRGLSTGYNNSDTANLVATYIDDEPIGSSSNSARGGFFGVDLMPYDLGRIEILKGPQGTLYGADAMGGLIKYSLRKPDLNNFEARAGGDVDYVDASGSVGGMGRGAVNVPIVPEKLAIRLSGFYQDNTGWIDNIGTGVKDSNSSTQSGGRATLLWQVTDRLAIQATVLAQDIHSDDNTAVTVDEASGKPVYGPYKQSTYFPEPFRQETRDYSVHIDWDLNFAKFTSSSSYSTLRSQLNEDFTPASPLYTSAYPDALSNYGFADYVSKYTEEARLASSNDRSLQWMFGAFYTMEHPGETENWFDFGQNKAPLPSPYNDLLFGTNPNPPNFTERALFANGTYKVTDRIDISGGTRYAQDDSYGCSAGYIGLFGNGGAITCYHGSYQGVWTWMGNARFHLNQDAMVYARVATGYRPGGVNTGSPAQGVFPSYIPDTLTNYEAGFKGEYLDHTLQLSASAFHIDWKHIQLQALSPEYFAYTTNGGTATSNGVEMTSSYLPYQGLTLGFTFAYTDAHLTQDAPQLYGKNGDPLPESPRYSGSLTADYVRRLDGGISLLFGGGYRYRDMVYSQFRSAPQFQSSLYPYPQGPQNIVDVYSGVKLDRTVFRLYVKNLFNNQSYSGLVYAVDPTRPLYVPVQPLTVGFSVDYRF